ncbi:bifunctional diguanylate cyclase/phosphodiesterase [Actinoplanes sp. N902-109]|uniref:putative bifunctional diguanylate cyclase/phosphodiesterase n=1 Tax=Actinoplanes sp. (strain N902-109) TaxID=649831 RepID=UPI0003295868|nr:bifunctional diguanylate cyclase/phosphodiesterase [Actinoplanes sp. N902-109]AGL17405.1 8-amino-7-oxononanoate synthase [Actinoplanes sp. N902-109]
MARVSYLAWVTALCVLYYAWPGSHVFSWGGIGLSAAAAVLVGVRQHRPRRPLPWYLISAALVFFVSGDTVYYVKTALGQTPPFPDWSDVLYLLVYPLLAGGLVLFIRSRAGQGNRAALLDAAVPTVSLGLLSWVYMIAPYTRDTELTVLEKAVSVSYPLGDVLALAILLRLLTAPGHKPRAVTWLTLSLVGLLFSDVVYGLARLDSNWQVGGPIDLGWIVFYAAAGYAALDPSMRELTMGNARSWAALPTGGRRLILLTAAALIAPGVLLAQDLTGDVTDAPVIAAGSALMFLLVMARVGGLLTERVALASEITRRDSEAYFRTLIQSASDVILIVGEDDRIRYASPSAGTLLGHGDLTGEPVTLLVADVHHNQLREALAVARAGSVDTDALDFTAVTAEHRLLQVECTIRDLRAESTVAGLVLTVRDVTERRQLENDLAHQAFHDGLTGLANRELFRNRLEYAYAGSVAAGRELGVVFVDLDDFKEVNDTLGHAIGDQLLIAVGRRITQAIGGPSTAARMGGDEFAALVEVGPGLPGAEEIAERVVAALLVPVELSDGHGGTHVVSGAASVGVATSLDATSPTELLRHADLALYLAKGAGKGTWQRYRSDLHTAMVERLALRTALHEAVDAEQFVLQYQPIVDVSSQAVVGVEALVRWRHPEKGLLGPYHFIELAEENGAIVGIGEWVLRESLRQIARWHAEQPDATLRYISVNVSARQFRQPGFVDRVRAALTEAGARPEWLLLEITESLVLRDAEQVWADLEALRALGVRIAIDDFGTGYSSLSYLRQMPVDVLKIDKSFIDDIVASKQQRALVNAIVTLARNLDLTVVAEGIEDAGQHALLARMGCPYGQGYLFSKPVWPADVPALTNPAVPVA